MRASRSGAHCKARGADGRRTLNWGVRKGDGTRDLRSVRKAEAAQGLPGGHLAKAQHGDTGQGLQEHGVRIRDSRAHGESTEGAVYPLQPLPSSF